MVGCRPRARLVLLAACGCAGPDASSARAAPVASGSAPPPAASAGAAAAVAPPAATTPAPPRSSAPSKKVWARTRFVWIRPEPGSTGWIGYLWLGGSVRLREEKAYWGPSCAGSFHAVEPRGFVCVDGVQATLDENDPVLRALLPYAPALGSPWPHRYGESRGLRRYDELPSTEQQRRREWDLAQHLDRIARARAGGERDAALAGVDVAPAPDTLPALPPLPPALREIRSGLTPLSTFAWSAQTRHGDRSFLLSADFAWVPKDRIAPYPHVSFQGVKLGRETQLPIAFFRERDRSRFRRASDGGFTESGETFRRLAWVGLTGRREAWDGETFLETREADTWIRASDAVVPAPGAPTTPWGATIGEPDTTGKAPAGRATWIEASIWKGWLIAFEGTWPVYATLISPGRGGTPQRGSDPLATASTPTGSFRISGKFATATMSAPHDFIHSDVPWTQNFHGPHALHGAYWHDRWGERMSAGCINVSPIDGKWLFEFTEPPVPEGWHAVRWRATEEPATLLFVHD